MDLLGIDLSPGHLAAARAVVERNTIRTPILDAEWLRRSVGRSIKLKAESLQRTGSFKVRGVSVRLNSQSQSLGSGVVAASAGNHALALAHVAAAQGISCQIFMPSTASVAKVRAVEAKGATLILRDETVDGCLEEARRFAEENGATFVHPFDDPDIIRGQATLGVELLEQAPNLANVVVPVGGGGLAGGVAAVLKESNPKIRVIGVQAELCAPLARPGQPVGDLRFALADGIAIKKPGSLTRPLLERYLDELCTVPEDTIAEAIVALMQSSKLVVEGAGAVAIAALLSGAVRITGPGETVAVLSGGNIDLDRLSAAGRLHEATRGTSVQIATRVPDHPGGLAALLVAVAEGQGNVLSVEHVRDAGQRGFHETGIELVIQTRGAEHRQALVDGLQAQGYEIDVLASDQVTSTTRTSSPR